ncbi:MAG: HAD family hydrolase, partial [Rhizobiaceae bacterium]
GNRDYIPLDTLHLENLEIVLAKFELEDVFNEVEKMQLNRGWEKIPLWPDTKDSLELLRQKFIIAPCSNGSIALMTRLARFGGLQWDAIVGADIAQDYKPASQTYLKSAAALGCEPQCTLMVAAHNSDLEAAAVCGLKTAFFPRLTEHGPSQTIDLAPTEDWDFSKTSLSELTDILMENG